MENDNFLRGQSGRRALRGALGLMIASGLVGISGAPAGAEEQPQPDAIDVIESAAPEVVSSSVAPEAGLDGAEFSVADGVVSIDEEAIVEVDFGSLEVAIELPNSGEAVLDSNAEAVEFDNLDGSTTSVFATDVGTVTAVTTIASSDSPTEYAYTYSGIDEIREADDNGLSLWAAGEQVGFLMLPWAVDANGEDVPTWYVVDGLTVTQIVDHEKGEYEYPIVADPSSYLGSNSLYSATLNPDLNSAGVVIQVVPMPNINWGRMARSNGIPPYDALAPAAYRTNAMHDQLVCHWVNAGYAKVPWNLDSWRPDVGYPATVFAGCNPN